MRLSTLVCIPLLVIAAVVPVPASVTISDNVVFLESPDAKGNFQRERINACLNQLVREMDLKDKHLPTIVVMHVSDKVGRAVGVEHTSLRRNSERGGSDGYYEFWIVGQGQPVEYVLAVEKILEHHFHLNWSDEHRKGVMVRVMRYLNNTVNAYGQ